MDITGLGVDDEDGIGEAVDDTERGIPHKPHAFRAAGERPGGLRNPHISHSQTSKAPASAASSTSVEPILDFEFETADVFVFAPT